MNAKDLMIDDWVSTPNGYRQVKQNFGLDGIYTRLAPEYDYPEDWDEKDLQPIPLTPEILEKNGFEARGYEELVLDADEYCFALQKGVDGINAWWWEMFSSPIIPINYIHELQHVLRLCGIEKEIEL